MFLISTLAVTMRMPKAEAQLTQEIAYDDGTAEDGRSYAAVGPQMMVRFSLPSGWTEAKLLTAKYYIFRDPVPFKVHVYGSDRSTDLITPFEVTPTSTRWFDVDLSGLGLTVTEDFYITLELMEYSKPFIGFDMTEPIVGRSYGGTPGDWYHRTNGDYMIRAVVQRIAHAPIYQGDLILTDNDVAVIEGRFDINGSIIIEENATLILTNAFLNFTQTEVLQYNITLRNPSNGNPRLLVYNSTITSDFRTDVYLQYNSTAVIDNSTISLYIVAEDHSVLSITSDSYVIRQIGYDSPIVKEYNSTIQFSDNYNSAEVWVCDSEINTFAFEPKSVECTISKLKPGLVSYWNFITNCSVSILPGGYTPNITLTNTSVNIWNPIFAGSSNISINNSTMGHPAIWGSSLVSAVDSTFTSYLSARGTSVTSLINTTYSGIPHIRDQARIQVAWYLGVHVVDSNGQDVPSANVTATYPNATAAESTLTDSNGWVRLTLMEKMMNATGEYSVGNYTVEATYESYSTDTTVNMTENQQITLTLEDLVIPEFPSFLILPLFMIATLLAVIAYRRKTVSDRTG